jgi:IclR helix-turn-helix domain
MVNPSDAAHTGSRARRALTSTRGSDGENVSPGIAYWQAAIEDGIDPAAAALMVAQPGFADACRLSLRHRLERYDRNPLLSRAAKDIKQLFYGYFVLYLHARDGITLTAIRDVCREIGLASRGRALAILVHLRAIGYIHADPNKTDGRVRRYLPSEQMTTALRGVITDDLQAFCLIEPTAVGIAERMTEPEFFKAFVLRLGKGLLDAVKASPVSEVSHFVDRDAGMIILSYILATAEDGDAYPPRGPVRMSVTELSKRFKVSRSHVFRLLRDAEKLGLLVRNPDEQTGTITEKLRADLIAYHVFVFMGLASCIHAALMSDRGTMTHAVTD